MPSLLTIKLENLRFYCYHGLYAQERQTGGEYQVDLQVDCNNYDAGLPISSLSQTIDYVQLYAIIKEEMNNPRDLLETLAMSIVNRIAAGCVCQHIAIEIKKFAVPIPEFSGNTAVRFEWSA